MEKANLADKLALIHDYWTPRIIGEVQGLQVRLAKIRGEFTWHRHDDEDELFLVLEGRLRLRFRDRDVVLDRGEMIVVPRGTEHLPVAEGEVHLLLVEPASTVNTGDAPGERTVAEPEWI